LFEAIGWPD